MCVYVRTKFQVSSIILTSFRREVILPTPLPTKRTPKNPTQIKVNLKTIPNRCFKHNLFVHKSVSGWPTSRINILTIYYKLGQLCFITNWGKCYYKLGQLSYYKMGQTLLQIGAAITNQGNRYYKLGQTLLQIRAAITNWGITTNTEIFTFIAVLTFKLLSRKALFINRKDNRNC